MMKYIRIIHQPTKQILADGPLGWGITSFEGNFYIQKKYLCRDNFKVNFMPGICIYKFFYVWLDLYINNQPVSKNIAWLYWLPNPLLPFIWFRIALPRYHPELTLEYYEKA